MRDQYNRPPLKAIDTSYNGYLFRSRLEARWAVFFDTLDVRYEYEPEGFEFSDCTRYLPDFWLPQQEMWVEIKPITPTDAETQKAWVLATAARQRVAFIVGSPWFSDSATSPHHVVAPKYGEWQWLRDAHWCTCNGCGAVGLHAEGWYGSAPCDCGLRGQKHELDILSERLMRAYDTARSRRFEHQQ